LGNQTSQFFANVYLDPLDHFVREEVCPGGYVRYVDDFLVFDDDKGRLAALRQEIDAFLCRLRLHTNKTVVFPVAAGIRFLGYRVLPTHRRLPLDNVFRFRRRLRRLQDHYGRGLIGARRCSSGSWPGWDTRGRPIPTSCGSGCSANIPSVGARQHRRVLRGGAFTNQSRNVRSANRNNNGPADRNNNIGLRPASTLQQAAGFA
jgi:hypothetical protein